MSLAALLQSESVMLTPSAEAHDLLLLIACAPEDVKWHLDDAVEALAGQDTARHKAEWCESWARRHGMSEYDRAFYLEAARLLRNALPGLPEHAPPKPPDVRPSVEQLYAESERAANRRGARRRRG